MPGNPTVDASVRKAKDTVRRAETEIGALTATLACKENCVGAYSIRAIELTTKSRAQLNLNKVALRANRLGDAYISNAYNLQDAAAASDGLRNTNILLCLSYIAIAVGKVMDIIATVTGTGKWITSGKTMVTDVVEGYYKADPNTGENASSGMDKTAGIAQAVDIALLEAKERELFAAAKSVQMLFGGVVDLVKDIKSILKGPDDLNKVKASIGQWSAKLAEKIAKLTDAVAKLTKLVDELTKLYGKFDQWMDKVAGPSTGTPPKFDVKGVAPPRKFDIKGNMGNWWGDPKYRMQVADYISVVKYAIEALINVYHAVGSGIDALDSYKASAAASSLADRQLASSGYRFNIDLIAMADLSDADINDYMRVLTSGADARQLAYDTGTRAIALKREVTLLNQEVMNYKARAITIRNDLSGAINKLEATGKDLESVERDLMRQRASDPVSVGATVDQVKEEKRRIADAIKLAAPDLTELYKRFEK